MSKPTLEKYERACKNVKSLSQCIRDERKTLDAHLDKALEIKKTINIYEEALEVAKETKLKYELYEAAQKAKELW